MCFSIVLIFCRQAFPSSAEPAPGMRQDGSDSGLRMGPTKSPDVQNEPSVTVEPSTPPANGQHPHPIVKSKSGETLKSNTRVGRRVYTGGYQAVTTPVEVAEHELQQHQAEVHCEEGTDLLHSVEVGTHIVS